MLEVLLVLAVFVIGVQALAITLLVKLVNKEREVKKAQVKQSRQMIKALSKLVFEVENEKEDYKEAYNNCYAEYRALFKENKVLKQQLNRITKIHGDVVNNIMMYLKQGKIIKSKYMDNIVPYQFETMTMEEVEQFFGQAR